MGTVMDRHCREAEERARQRCGINDAPVASVAEQEGENNTNHHARG